MAGKKTKGSLARSLAGDDAAAYATVSGVETDSIRLSG